MPSVFKTCQLKTDLLYFKMYILVAARIISRYVGDTGALLLQDTLPHSWGLFEKMLYITPTLQEIGVTELCLF